MLRRVFREVAGQCPTPDTARFNLLNLNGRTDMSKQTTASIGKHYNNTVTRNEGIYCLSIVEPRLGELKEDGVYHETLAGLRERMSQLEPLEKHQVATQQRYEKLIDRLEKLLFQSIGRVSTVDNLAN